MPILLTDKQFRKLDQLKRARKMREKRSATIRPERKLRRAMDGLWKRILFPATDRIKELIRTGAGPEAIADFVDWTLNQAEASYGLEVSQVVTDWMLGVQKEARFAIMSGLRESLGIDVTAMYDNPQIQEVMQVAKSSAVQQITSVPREFLQQVVQTVFDAYVGKPLPQGRSLVDQISELGNVSRNRARVIARDQTKKANSTINQFQQQSIGIDEYIWKNMRDERVVGNPTGLFPKGNKNHHNHWIMEGLYCKWADATVYSSDKGKTWKARTDRMPKTHPGMEILCRCHAEAVIDVKKILQFAEAA